MSMLPVPGERPGLPSLPVLDANAAPRIRRSDHRSARPPARRLPEWLKRPIPAAGGMSFTRSLVSELGLETVCESARCPNRSECWTRRTATFMILGDVCTRPCGFCAVKRGQPEEVALDEPERLAEACHRLGLRHVVITSVTRDDLPDGGAEHFRRCVLAVRRRTGATIEVLTPDFDGRGDLIDVVLSAAPEVFNHNLETVARLQQHVRRKSQYEVSLAVLEHVKQTRPEIRTKSGLMLGLGETTEELARNPGRPPLDRLRPAHARPVPSAVAATPSGGCATCPPRSSTSWAGWRAAWASPTSPAGRSSVRQLPRRRDGPSEPSSLIEPSDPDGDVTADARRTCALDQIPARDRGR